MPISGLSKRFSFSFLLCLFLFFVVGCGQSKPLGSGSVAQGDANQNISPGGSIPIASSIFPHSDNWAEPAQHGGWVNRDGAETCLKCHVEMGPADGAPSCSSCHALFPHKENWVKKENHGEFVTKNGQASCATQCHGTDLKGGLSGISCSLCHTIFPHSRTWKNAEEHGPVAKEGGKNLCKGCHGNDFRREVNGKNCFSCHALYPHEAGWFELGKHGEYVVQNGTAGCATQCHGPNLQGGLSGRACDSCHVMMPHAAGWGTFEGHARHIATTLDHNLVTCQRCHGEDYSREINGKNCFSCHAGYPHTSNWGEGSQHGPMAYGLGKQGCATSNCHGTRFEGNVQTGAPSCTGSCHGVTPHADYPHELSPKWMTLETRRESLRDEAFHGDRFIRELQRGDAAPCSACHGVNYDRPVGGAQCTVCHSQGVSHRTVDGVAWNSGTGHGKFFSSQFNAVNPSSTCRACHGSAIDFNATQTRDELQRQSLCYTCHLAYPHIAFRNDGNNHAWEPVVANECGPRNVTNWGHIFALMNGPLFSDTRATCGGGAGGSCHADGLRAYRTGNAAEPCALCHNVATTLPPPDLPECEVPPSDQQIAGAPMVIRTWPPSGEQNAGVSGTVVVYFNEAMFSPSVKQAGTVVLRKVSDDSIVPTSLTCPDNNWCKTTTLRPLNPLQNNTNYEIRVTTVAKDWGGTPMAAEYRGTFKTVPLDVTRPTVVSTVPVSGAVGISADLPQIDVFFSESLRPIGHLGFTIKVVRVFDPNPEGGVLNVREGFLDCVTADCRQTRFSIPAPRRGYPHRFVIGEAYTVTIFASQIKDLMGNAMAADYHWTFTTR
ncbi:MAG: Ig-like domain-containing protein [Deltaproteobacteria bacterium]|nr:Ig-like domain-containing protein [Deltaproteobacteria bacterium]